MPSVTSNHDPKYHLWGLIGIKNGAQSSADLRECIMKANDDFVRHFRLMIRDSPMQKVGELIALELEQMGYIIRDPNGYRLTEKGMTLSCALENDSSSWNAVIEDFMPTMLSTFEEMRIFVRKILQFENGTFIPKVPAVTEVFGSSQSYDQTSYLQQCKTYISSHWNWNFPLKWDEGSLSEKIAYWTRESTSTKPSDLAKAIYRDYFLSQYFGGELGDVKYKVIRDRLHYFGLVNYSEHLPQFDGEVMYPLVWRAPKLPYARPLVLAGDTLYMSNPTWTEISKDFLSALWEVHQSSAGVGYVPVMDLRDKVCLILKISDMSFNNLLKQARIEGQRGNSPIRILADASDLLGRETSKKRIPIDFGRESGMGVRTLISLNLCEQKS